MNKDILNLPHYSGELENLNIILLLLFSSAATNSVDPFLSELGKPQIDALYSAKRQIYLLTGK